MRHVLVLAACVAVMGAAIAFGQTAGPSASAPYVSKLKAIAQQGQIILSWRDPPEVTGGCRVYRSTEEITDATFASAELLGVVPPNVGYYIDTPPDTRGYYYAVLVEDGQGGAHRMFVPFRNKTSAPLAAAAPEERLAATITGIAATPLADGSGIEISFVSSDPQRDLILFRSTVPLVTAEDLLGTTTRTQLEPGTTRTVAPGLAGIGYWFAVLDAGLFRLGKAPLTPGANATTVAVSLSSAAPTAAEAITPTVAAQSDSGGAPAASSPAPSLPSPRDRTLPLLMPAVAVESGLPLGGDPAPEVPPRREVAPLTQQAIARLIQDAGVGPAAELRPQLLEEEQVPEAGEAGSLQSIVETFLAVGAWPEAELRLRGFLALKREAGLEARCRFYLGQASWFQGKVREAIMEFLLCEEFLYPETRPWLDACVERLATLE